MSIYENFIQREGYDDSMRSCIKGVVDKFNSSETNEGKPGMLLGKIQSGKTKTFIGVIAKAFDEGYGVCIVLTKGTNVLAEQTFKRLYAVFEPFIREDEVHVYDIMSMPTLTAYIRDQHLIVVVKKEAKNLKRLEKMFEDYPDLRAKRVLIIDDEADFGGIGFSRDASQLDGVSMNVLANRISDIRGTLTGGCSFLQVTATPYSLYLQPDVIRLNQEEFQPIRPAFTQLVPIHDKYVGGEDYFEESKNPQSPAAFLFSEIPEKELQVLGKKDDRYLNNILTTPNLSNFRRALMNYLVGGAVRTIQERRHNKKYKSSFIVHAETSKEKHAWQAKLVKTFFDKVAGVSEGELKGLVKESYGQLDPSVRAGGFTMPDFEEICAEVSKTLELGYLGIYKINSDEDVRTLLGDDGQLRLDNPYNVFIGGQILDRGITVDRLIGFFYGRSPKKFQQDTVLQHSRMYGARAKEDMCVTRLYTSARIYGAMEKMHAFDSTLRKAFEQGEGHDEVVFIERDTDGTIVPCSPSKIIITNTETIIPHKRYLPIGFQTIAPSYMARPNNVIDDIIAAADHGENGSLLLTREQAEEILSTIRGTYEYAERWNNEAHEWDLETHLSLLRRFVDQSRDASLRGMVHCIVKRNREITRTKSNGASFSDAPEDANTDLKEARRLAQNNPCLILLQQNGREENQWRGAKFWWPVLIAPGNAKSAVFATETM